MLRTAAPNRMSQLQKQLAARSACQAPRQRAHSTNQHTCSCCCTANPPKPAFFSLLAGDGCAPGWLPSARQRDDWRRAALPRAAPERAVAPAADDLPAQGLRAARAGVAGGQEAQGGWVGGRQRCSWWHTCCIRGMALSGCCGCCECAAMKADLLNVQRCKITG